MMGNNSFQWIPLFADKYKRYESMYSPTYLRNQHPKKIAYTLCDIKTPTKFVFSNIKEKSISKF